MDAPEQHDPFHELCCDNLRMLTKNTAAPPAMQWHRGHGPPRDKDPCAGRSRLAAVCNVLAAHTRRQHNPVCTHRLQWSVKRRQRGHETLGQFALSMRLLVGKALRRMGRLEEAELAFKVLAGSKMPSAVGLEYSRTCACRRWGVWGI